MSDLYVKIDDKAVQAQLVRAIRAQDPELREEMRRIGDPVAREAKQRAPKAAVHRSGGKTLADSIYVRVRARSVEIVSNKKYAGVQHWGGTVGPHKIFPRKKHALAFGGIVVSKVNHPGGSIRGKLFIWNAVASHRSYILDRFEQMVTRTWGR